MIQALKDEDPRVRYQSAEALGNIRDSRAVDPLIQALKDDDSSVRYWAIVALGKINDNRAADPLIQASREDEDSYIRDAASNVLREQGWDER